MQDFFSADRWLEDRFAEERYVAVRRRRQLVFLGVPLLLGVVVLTLLRYLAPPEVLARADISLAMKVLSWIIAAVPIVGLLLYYLQGNTLDQRYGRDAESFDYMRMLTARLDRRVDEIEERFKGTPSPAKVAQDLLPTAERERIVAELQAKIEAQASKAVLDTLHASIEAEYRKELRNRDMEREIGRTLQRLNAEIGALGRRGNLNLVIGIVTTTAGLISLAYFVVTHGMATPSTTTFLMNFLPRLSLVIFIELFAFFFLRLYKATLAEIKYFQNEMTNIETKAIALRAAIDATGDTHVDVIRSLAQTERNHVLEKGQTTVELERSRLDHGQITEVARTVLAALGERKAGA